MILAGAGLIEATGTAPLYQHMTTRSADTVYDSTEKTLKVFVSDNDIPAVLDMADEVCSYVMFVDGDEIVTEPYIATSCGVTYYKIVDGARDGDEITLMASVEDSKAGNDLRTKIAAVTGDIEITGSFLLIDAENGKVLHGQHTRTDNKYIATFDAYARNGVTVLADYYLVRASNGQLITLEPETFGGNFYLEADCLMRNTQGVDMPAEFIIPNCRVQSAFTFSLAATGDPSTFTFTLDAFPDYTRWDQTKKVLAAVQMFQDSAAAGIYRYKTVDGKTVAYDAVNAHDEPWA